MRRFLFTAAFLALLLSPDLARAVATYVAVRVNTAPAASVTCTVNYPSYAFFIPVAVGTNVATCVVLPSNWIGQLGLSGTDAASFTMSGANVLVAVPLTQIKVYHFTVSASP